MKAWATMASLLIILCIAGQARAALTLIGEANYMGNSYNLIYDDDDTGYGTGGLVWLDYSNAYDSLAGQKSWAAGLGASLTVTLYPGYTTDIDWTTGWRLPDTVDGAWVAGFEGDPDDDNIYTYTGGYNLANSEMGHLFYVELKNTGYQNTDGSYNPLPPLPDRFLLETGDFKNLKGSAAYWSGSNYTSSQSYGWLFYMGLGEQGNYRIDRDAFGIAVISGQVSIVPIPGGACLLGVGLLCVAGYQRNRLSQKKISKQHI